MPLPYRTKINGDPARLAEGIMNMAWVVVPLAIVVEAGQFIGLAVRLARLPLLGDARLFFSMGRAWLNSLVFYKDLFETKPPGVFLLAALSLKSTGNNSLYSICEVVLLGTIGPILAVVTYYGTRSTPDVRLRTGLSLLLGIVAAGYTLRWSDDFQAEGFGLLFAILPALMIGHGTALDIAAGLSLGVAAMMKEPFGVAGALAMFVFCQDWRVLRALGVAGATCLAVLWFARAVGPYFTIYLPEMISGRSIASSVYTHYGLGLRFAAPHPLWLRSLNVYRMFREFGTPAANICLSAFFLASSCLWVERTKARYIAYAVVLLVGALLTAHAVDLMEQLIALLHRQGQGVPWGHPIMLRLVAEIAIPPLVLGFVAWRARVPRSFYRRFCLLLAGLFVASALANYGGGDYDHRYLIFALPFFVALALECIMKLRRASLLALGALLVANSFLPGRYPSTLPDPKGRLRIQESLQSMNTARRVDSLLDGCGFQRYFAALDTLSLQAYTFHSPYQINYGVERGIGSLALTASTQSANSYLAEKLNSDLDEAPVLILASDADRVSLPPPLKLAVEDRTITPPECARPFLPIPGLEVFFKQPAGASGGIDRL